MCPQIGQGKPLLRSRIDDAAQAGNAAEVGACPDCRFPVVAPLRHEEQAAVYGRVLTGTRKFTPASA